MKTKLTKLFASATASLTFAAGASWAETAEAGDENMASEVHEMDDFVVKGETLYGDQITALKTPTPIIDVPQSLTVTTAEEISLRGFTSVEDIVAYTPGVNISQGEGHRDAVVFRGVRSTADFFVDGVRDDVQYYRPLYNVEQVEILRGPNALFFGRGGAGGVLNRVTKKGVIGEDFNEFSGSINTFGGAIATIDSNVTVNEKTAVRINAYYESFENDRDYSDGDLWGVNPTAKFLLSEKTTLDVSYEYLDHERFIDRGIPTGDDLEPVDSLNDTFFGDPDLNESTLEAHILRAILQHQFSDELKANLTASYGDYDKTYQNFYVPDGGYDQIGSPDEVTLDGYLDTTDRQNTVLSGNLIGEFETGDIEHTVIFGAEYIYTESDQDRYNALWSDSGSDKETFKIDALPRNGTGVTAGGAPTSVDFTTDLADDTSTELDVYSIFIQDEIQLFEQLTVVLGGRFDSFDISVDDNEPGGTDGSQKDEEFTPRVGIVYKPQENLSIYASYSETFVPQSGEQYANLGSEGLDPNEYTNLEAGVKWDFAPGYSLTAAVFQIEQDIVESDGGDGSLTLENEINGFETQFSGQITDSWFLTAGYSYLEGELDDPNPLIDGNDPRELPEHMFSVWNYYRVTEKLAFGLGAIYQDESYITESNDTQLPDFWRVDAAAYYQINEDFRLQVNVENLLDEEYYPSSHSDNQATVGDPIHATFKIVGRF